MTDNTQELENLIRNNIHTFADEYLELDECVAALTAYTNKRVEEVLDRLEASIDSIEANTGIDGFHSDVRELQDYIDIERNKLKEPKV